MSYSEAIPAPFSESPAAAPPRKKEPAARQAAKPPPEGELRETFVTNMSEYMGGHQSTAKAIELKLTSVVDAGTTSSRNDALNTAMQDWITVTHHVMDYKYINDVNNYVLNVQNEENKRLTGEKDGMHNDIMITKRMFLMRKANSEKLYSRVRMVLHTMLFVSLMAFIYMNQVLIGGGLAMFLMAVIAFAFAIYVIMYIKTSSSKRYDDWSKFYWNSGDDIETEEGDEEVELGGGTCGNGMAPQ